MKTGKKLAVVCSLPLFFVACNNEKDYYDPEHAIEIIKEKYELAFKSRFGEIAPNHTWGFENLTTKSTRVVEEIIKPDRPVAPPQDEDFKNKPAEGLVPVGATLETGTVGTYLIDSNCTSVNIWKWDGGITLYITGNVTPAKFDISPKNTIYLCKDATLNLTAEQAEGSIVGSKFYLAEGSKIKVADPEGTLQLNNGAEIYNRGTIEAHNLMACVTGTTLYNQGKIKLSGTLSGENNGSTIINDGDITAGGIKTQGGCAFWNSGEIKVNGKIELNSIGNVWVNEGPITTTDFEYMGGSGNVFECCLLTVENELKIDLTSNPKCALIVDAEAGIVARQITMYGPSNMKLGAKAVVKAMEKITMDIGTLPVPTGVGFGDGYGVHAIGEEYAVLTAPLIERGPACTAGWSPFVVSYSGKLYVATDNHFEQAYDGYQQRPHIYWMDDEAKLIEGAGAAPISVSETECCPGYEPQGDEFLGRIFAEDLNVDEKGDFDFNDVVLDIYKGKDGTYAMLMAAGGTLPIYVGESGANEVHSLFGVPTSTMVNTYANQHAEKAPVKITLPASVSTAADVKIYVAKEEGIIELFVKQGKAPSKILVKSKQTDWADERQSIEVKYPKFKEYVVDPTVVWWED